MNEFSFLPVIAIKCGTPDNFRVINVLLDTGAQLTLLNRFALHKIVKLPRRECKILSLSKLGRIDKVRSWSTDVNFILPDDSCVNVPVTAILDLKFPLVVDKFSSVVNYCTARNIPVSESFQNVQMNDNVVQVEGIIGIDSLKFFTPFEIVELSGMTLLKLVDGYVPLHFPGCRNVGKSFMSVFLNSVPLRSVRKSMCKKSNNSKLSVKHRTKNSVDENIVIKSNGVNQVVQKGVTSPVLQTPSRMEYPLVSHADHVVLDNQDCCMEQFNYWQQNSESVQPSISYNVDSAALFEEFERSVSYDGLHYYVCVPWIKEIYNKIPHNLFICKQIAKSVYNQNVKNQISDEYNEIFMNLEKEKIIERLPSKVIPEHYKFLPHRAVCKTSDLVHSTKIRPVFNASLSVKNSFSLNDAVPAAPNLLSNLLHLLIYFRSNKYVLLADIRKAFLQVKLKNEKDRNSFAFVLYHNGKFSYFRFAAALFGFTLSPFFLLYVLRLHASKCSAPLNDIISNKIYMDNVIVTADTKEFILSNVKPLQSEMKKGGFKLQDFCTNILELQDSFDDEISCKEPDRIKVLGLVYNSRSDTVKLNAPILPLEAPTKRAVVSAVASIFDPLNILAPFVLPLKLFIRKLSAPLYNWDTPLLSPLLLEWRGLAKDFNSLPIHDVNLPRSAFSNNQSVSLIIYCDASAVAYGFIIYVKQNNVMNLLYCSSHVAPKTPTTLPKREFLALYESIVFVDGLLTSLPFRDVEVSSINFLSDSTIALAWLRNAPSVKNVFVSNRIISLNKISIFSRCNFSHICTNKNISDMVTRPAKPAKFRELMQLLISGLPEEDLEMGSVAAAEGGSSPGGSAIPIADVADPVGDGSCSVVAAVSLSVSRTPSSIPSLPLVVENFSCFELLIRRGSSILYAVSKFKNNICTALSLRARVLRLIILSHQHQYFSEIFNYLSLEERVEQNCPPLCRNLQVFIDLDGLLRSRGRLKEGSGMSYDSVNPYLINGSSHLGTLLIRYYHEKACHLGLSMTLSYLRAAGLWLTNARSNIYKLVNKCVICRRYQGKAFKNPPPPVLPECRTQVLSPFCTTGIDYAGPFRVSDFGGNKIKVYILIFTCYATRACHLEYTLSLEVSEFLLAFYRFINVRGVPNVIFCDNAVTFKRGSEILCTLWQSPEVTQTFTKLNINFNFIPAYSPTAGSLYERLVGVAKSCIYKTVGKKVMPISFFQTLLSDVTLTMNNRPLYYQDRDGSSVILTPNSFLYQKQMIPGLIPSPDAMAEVWNKYKSSSILKQLVCMLDERESLVVKFQQLFFENYLNGLREHGIPKKLYSSTNTAPQVGDILVFRPNNVPKYQYELVKVISVVVSTDGLIRSVKVKRPSGELLLTAPYNLIPLELNIAFSSAEELDSSDADDSENEESSSEDIIQVVKPEREAKIAASKTNTQLALRGMI